MNSSHLHSSLDDGASHTAKYKMIPVEQEDQMSISFNTLKIHLLSAKMWFQQDDKITRYSSHPSR
jgi:hypothetical protein